MNLYLGSWYGAWPDGQLSVEPTNAETLAPFDDEALRRSYFGRRSSRNSQHGLSASAAEVEQACVVEEQPTRTSASRRRIKRLQKRVEKSVAPVSSYLWQSDVRHVIVSGMRDGRVSQRAVIRIVSSRPGSPISDGRRWMSISQQSTDSKGGRLCHATEIGGEEAGRQEWEQNSREARWKEAAPRGRRDRARPPERLPHSTMRHWGKSMVKFSVTADKSRSFGSQRVESGTVGGSG